MPEQHHKSFSDRIRRAAVVLLTILPYFLVTTCGALAVAVVAKTSARTINTKFDAVIHVLKRR